MNAVRAFRALLAAGAVTALGVVLAAGQQPAVSAVYTTEQAAAGRAAYQANCAACHLNDLRGRNEAPPLAGPNFMSAWGQKLDARAVRPDRIVDAAGTRESAAGPVRQHRRVHPAVERSPGRRPGAAPTTAARLIVSVATGQAPSRWHGAGRTRRAAGGGTRIRRRDPGRPRPAAVQARRRRAQGPRGVTIAGEVKNYVPVTDEMLRNPPPGRLADGAPQLSGLELQSAQRDHARQRQGPAAGLGRGR